MDIAMKFGINTTLVALKMEISMLTLVVFTPNFTATHAITSTNPRKILTRVHNIMYGGECKAPSISFAASFYKFSFDCIHTSTMLF